MPTTVLENAIRDYFKEKHDVEYIRGLRVLAEDGVYTLILDLNQSCKPLTIKGEFPDDQSFLNYIYKEIDSRRLFTVSFFNLIKEEELFYQQS